MGQKILIFTATYNGAGNIEAFPKAIDQLNLKVDVLIIDDNSPDQTWKIVKNYKNLIFTYFYFVLYLMSAMINDYYQIGPNL